MLKSLNAILNVVLCVMLVTIILNSVIGGIIFSFRDKRLKVVEENTKEEDARFCNLTSIKLFAGKLYCLKDSQRMVIVLSEDGKFEKS